MANFKSIVTDLGNEMLTRAIALNKTVDIKTAKIGSGRALANQGQLTSIVTPITATVRIGGKNFEVGDPSILTIEVQVSNQGILASSYIREMGLYANDGTGEILFAYIWLDGADSNNMLPYPESIDFPDTGLLFKVAIFITNQENANITVSFSLDAFVTYREMTEYVTQATAGSEVLDSISDRIGFPPDTPNATGSTIFSIVKWIANKFVSVWTDVKAGYLDATISSRATQTSVDTVSGKTDTINTNVNAVGTVVAGTSTTVNAIKTKTDSTDLSIGKNTDASGTTTVFARLKQAYDYLSTNITPARAAALDSPILSSGSVIKSIQRGLLAGNRSPSNEVDVDIAINTVNPNKCFVILDGVPTTGTNTYMTISAHLRGLTANTLTIRPAYRQDPLSEPDSKFGNPLEISWQLIEFY